MDYHTKKQLNYTIHYFIPWKDAKVLTNAIFKKKYQLIKTLNNTSRSRVDIIQVDDELLVLKEPVEKNKGNWFRFTTLMRKSEALQSCISMLILQEISIKTNKPLVVIEKKRMGMVIDSWYLYSYINGEDCVADDYPKVIDTLTKIHRAGYLHGDPQIRNFIKSKTGIQVIDVKISKHWNSIQRQLELVCLNNSIFETKQHIDKKTISYKIAKFIVNDIQKGFRSFKRKIRQIFNS